LSVFAEKAALRGGFSFCGTRRRYPPLPLKRS
jgi:hypothetical protein